MITEILKMVMTAISIIIIVFLVIFFGIRFINSSAPLCDADEQCIPYVLSCCEGDTATVAFNKGYETTLNLEKSISCAVVRPVCAEYDNTTLLLTNTAYCSPQRLCGVRPDCEAVCSALEERKNDDRFAQFNESAKAFGCDC